MSLIKSFNCLNTAPIPTGDIAHKFDFRGYFQTMKICVKTVRNA